jgi:hypothetical protein
VCIYQSIARVNKPRGHKAVKNYQRSLAVLAAWLYLLWSPAAAININLQYPGVTLFSATHDATAKAAINAAAADLSAAITSNLSAINTDVYTGTNVSTTATFDWKYEFSNPDGAGTITIDPATIPINTVTMHVGTEDIVGSTLGVGGPAGAGFQLSGSGFPHQWVNAVASAEAASEVAYKRGGGPVIGTLAGSSDLGGTVANYSIDFGIAYGSLSLDWNGVSDGGWHFNHTTNVAPGKNDLYSVALHEMLHALGLGSSDTWDSLVSGTTWSGTNASTLNGTGIGLINGAGDHIAAGIFSTHYQTGAPQEAAMDPDINVGTRKQLTALDLAFLRDIGYNTVNWVTPSFSPADFDEDGDVDGDDLATWQNSYGVNANGDTNNDGDTDGRDFLVWQRAYTGANNLFATVSVPEPAAGVLMLLSLVHLGRRRNSR